MSGPGREPISKRLRDYAEGRVYELHVYPDEAGAVADAIEALRRVSTREHYHDSDHAPCPVCSVVDPVLARLDSL